MVSVDTQPSRMLGWQVLLKVRWDGQHFFGWVQKLYELYVGGWPMGCGLRAPALNPT